MQEFNIAIRSFRQAQDFVQLAMRQGFDVFVGNARQQINGKDLMGLFSLDHSQPVQVSVNCDQEEFLRFREEVTAILA